MYWHCCAIGMREKEGGRGLVGRHCCAIGMREREGGGEVGG